MIGVSKIKFRVQSLCDQFVSGKFSSVIRRNCQRRRMMRIHHAANSSRQPKSVSVRQKRSSQKTAFAFNRRNDDCRISFAGNHTVQLPISLATAGINDCRTFIDHSTVVYMGCFRFMCAAGTLSAQFLVPLTISIQPVIDGLTTDTLFRFNNCLRRQGL